MSNTNLKRFVNLIAFIGLCMVAIALILQMIFNSGDIINAIRTIGECIAYSVTAIYALFYVRSKRNVWWWIAYVVAVTVVILLVIFR